MQLTPFVKGYVFVWCTYLKAGTVKTELVTVIIVYKSVMQLLKIIVNSSNIITGSVETRRLKTPASAGYQVNCHKHLRMARYTFAFTNVALTGCRIASIYKHTAKTTEKFCKAVPTDGCNVQGQLYTTWLCELDEQLRTGKLYLVLFNLWASMLQDKPFGYLTYKYHW